MARLFINQLKEGDSVTEIYQITEKTLRPNRNGNLYIHFLMADRSGTLSGRFWNATEELFTSFSENDYILCEGTVQRFQGSLQFIARKLTLADPQEVHPEDFSRALSIDTPALIRRLRELLHTIKTPELRDLADCFLADEDFLDRFSRTPAGVKLHHSYEGGLLEHTLSVMELAVKTSEVYGSRLNRDLLLMGAFIHDIGKIRELDIQDILVYTDEGQMLGHSFLAFEILHKKLAETETLTGEAFPRETEMLLKHFLLSHHGAYENGSPKLPMTLEALALHYLDSLDAKLAEFEKRIFDDPTSGTCWTNFIPSIERKLYKGNS